MGRRPPTRRTDRHPPTPALTANIRSRRSATSTPVRSGFFLRVDDFDTNYQPMKAAGVKFRTEPYGRVVVFRDIAGNHWDPLGNAASS